MVLRNGKFLLNYIRRESVKNCKFYIESQDEFPITISGNGLRHFRNQKMLRENLYIYKELLVFCENNSYIIAMD